MELVGVIPAAGLAKRLGNIPCSKEVLPLKDHFDGNEKKRVFSEFLLEAYKLGGIKNVYFVLRTGKWDIPAYYENGSKLQLNLSYLIMQYPYGVPFTLYEACPFVKDKIVALGFPDIIFSPKNAFASLYKKIVDSGADVVLGLFPIQTKDKWDMVELDANGNIANILIKQKGLDLKYGWTLAVWGPRFTAFLEERIRDLLERGQEGKVIIGEDSPRELYPGDLFLEAIKSGLKVESVIFENGRCIDLGTKEDLDKFRKSATEWDLAFDSSKVK